VRNMNGEEESVS